MKKVLFVFNHPAPYKVRFLNELSKYVDLTVIFERDKNSDRNKSFYSENSYLFKNVKIKGTYIGKENIISNGVKNHLKNNKYDLIIMNGYSQFSEMKAINYLIRKKIPYCLYINGGIIKNKENPIIRHLKRKYISHASFYFSPDERSNEYLLFYGANKNKIHNYPYSTIYENEIVTSLPTQDEIKEEKEKLNIKSEHVFISCGQLIKRKNYLELIKVWPKDLDKLLLIAGIGKEEDKIKTYLRQNTIKNVILLGYLKHEKLFEYYRISDAFIFPSLEDIYGHVINEALSQGLPVISLPNVNASRKLIVNGKNGYILKNLDRNNLDLALDKVISIDKNEALKTAKENTIEKMVDAHLKVLLND